jgi:two-component system response regulator YesN
MKKIMIVDDEILVRIGIQSLVKWEDYGYEIICDASNGEEALEKIEQYHPDIVLTDLMMSPIDGFELITKTKEKYPQIQFIVLSSYNDFDNVRAAMKLGAFDYIFKLTVKADELVKILQEASAAIKAVEPESDKGENSRKNLDVIKKKLIGKILNSEMAFDRSMEELKQLPLNINFDLPYRVLYLKIDNFLIARKKGDFMNLDLLLFTMENILEELFNRSYKAEVFQDNDYDFIIVINEDELQDGAAFVAAIEKEFKNFLEYIWQYCGIEVSGSLSRKFTGVEFLKQAIGETGDALEQRFWGETGRLNYCKAQKSETVAVPGEFRMFVLENLASNQDWHGVRSFLEQYLSFLENKKGWNSLEVRHLLKKVYRILSVSFAKCRIDIDVFVDRNGADMESAVNGYTFYNRIRQSMMELLEQYINEYESGSGKGCRKEVAEVKSFIQTHLKEELTLPEIASMVNMSESHFSHIFKKETGISLGEYINQVRIEQAKYLLKTSDLKINEIADEVGICNPNYFSTQFKRRTGMSPLEYRQDYLNRI